MPSLKSQIESLLFLSNRPLTANKIASLLSASPKEVETALEELFVEYKQSERGIKIFKNGKEWQMGTSPENAALVSAFLQEELTGELTKPQLETLAIIAYRGPITKGEIEQIRGINCSLILRNLLIRGLIQIEKKKDGEPVYSISMDFLKFLGVTSPQELPEYENLRRQEICDRYLNQQNSQGSQGLE